MGRKPVLTRIPDRVQFGYDFAPGEEVASDSGGDDRDDTQVGEVDPVPTNAGSDVAADRIRVSELEVVFDVLGHEIWKQPGDTVGTEIRRVLVEAGKAEDDAVYVHRNHARIEQEGENIVLRRIGENTLEVNGRPVEKGEVVPLADGDEVTFSDVATAVVRVEEIGEEKDSIASPETADLSDGSALDAVLNPKLRVERVSPNDRQTHEDEAIPAGSGINRSLDVLINTIPGEVLVLWAAIEGAAELYGFSLSIYVVLLVVAILATPVYVYRSIEKPGIDSNGFTESDVHWWQESNVRWQTVSATGAFLVWAYYLGGPFQLAGLQNASVAVALVIIYPVLIVISPYYGSFILYQFSNIFDHSSV